jgi:periplasmic divalent cation tolerance protein
VPDAGVSVVLATVPDAGMGRRLARTLLEERLIACATLVPGVTSLYRWEGEVQEEEEGLLVMKTRSELVPRLVARIPELHPYELPEVLALWVDDGLPAYCRWVLGETGG